MKIIFYESKIYLIFCKNSAGYQDKSSVSQIWYQCQVYENCQQILKFQKTDGHTNCTPWKNVFRSPHVLSCSTHIVYHPLGPAAWSTCLSHRLAGERRTETGVIMISWSLNGKWLIRLPNTLLLTALLHKI